MPYTSGVAAPTAAPPAPPIPLPPSSRTRFAAYARSLRPVWSKPAAFRALRVTLVMPALFAFTSQVLGNQQMATFAAFGSFATLLFATFGGSRLDKLVAHTLLAVAGSVLIIIGTAISFNTAVAAVVTVPVAFCVLFSGIVGAECGLRRRRRPGGLRATGLVASLLWRRPRPSGGLVAGLGIRHVGRARPVSPASRRPPAGRRRQISLRLGRPAEQRARSAGAPGRTVRRRWTPSAPS